MRISSLLKCLQSASRFFWSAKSVLDPLIFTSERSNWSHAFLILLIFGVQRLPWSLIGSQKGLWSQSQTLLHRKWLPLDTSIYKSIVSDTVQVTSGRIMTQKLEVLHAGVLGDNLSIILTSSSESNLSNILTASSESNLSIILTARSEPNSSIILTASSESENLG